MAFVIPTIYTAVDKMTPAFQKMAASSSSFAQGLEVAAHRSERAWNSVMPNFSDAFERRIQFMISMGQAMAVAGTALFAGKTIIDYERALANLRAITGATGQEFIKFKSIIEQTAKDTTVSAVDVATAFTTIGNAMPALLESADGLNTMTNAVIRLARASNMELQPAAESLTSILNQFGKSADYAETAIQAMAAGSKYGSSEISNLQASLLQYGKVADEVSGITLKESIALAELVSKYKVGADAGTELRNVLLEMGKGFGQDEKALKDLQMAGINIQMVTNKAVPFNDRLKEMSKILSVQNGVLHVFGKENEAMALTLLSNAAGFSTMAEKVNEVGNVERMAAENTNTLYYRFEKLKGAFANIVVASDASSVSLRFVNGLLSFMTNHLSAIVGIGAAVISFFVAWRIKIMAMSASAWIATRAVTALNFAEGLATVITGKYTAAMFATEAGMKGLAAAAWVAKTGLMGIVGISATVVFALAAIGHQFMYGYDSSVKYMTQLEKTEKGLYKLAKPLSENEIRIQKYNKAMEDFWELQNYDAYWKDLSPLGRMAASLTEPFANPFLYQKYAKATQALDASGVPRELQAPTPESFGITDSAAINDFYKGSKNGNTSTQYIHHTVDITQNGKTVASFNTAGLPSLGSTF